MQSLNAQYTKLTGASVCKFVCPITLQDEPGAELCNGHVLNAAVKGASRATVVQRKDVDNFFGTAIEPDFIRVANLPGSSPQELLKHTKGLTLTYPDGRKLNAFFGPKGSAAKFQQIELFNDDGSTFATPFLKDAYLGPEKVHGITVEWTMKAADSAVVGSLLKSAYLALFRAVGYEWVLCPSGDKLRRVLCDFYNAQAGRREAKIYFGSFRGACSVMMNDRPTTTPDTLKGGSMLFHFAEGDQTKGLLFAVSLLFMLNGRMWVVAMPVYQKPGHYFVAFEHYLAYLKDRTMPHHVYAGRYYESTFQISPQPLNIRYRRRGDSRPRGEGH